MRTVCRWVFVPAVLLLIQLPRAVAAGPDGEALYRRHCAPCHGSNGRGDGPDAGLFASRPRDLREGFLNKYPAADLVRRVREGAALQLGVDPPALRARATEVEALAAYMKTLPAIDWPQFEVGRQTYVDRCEVCHGAYGHPPADLPPGVTRPADLTAATLVAVRAPPALLALVRRGHERMPALVPRLPEADGPALAAFLRLLSPGFESWDRNCTACHGDDGRGEGRLAEALGMPPVAFDATYFRTHDPEQVRAAIWHMLARQKPTMPHFRWTLTEAQAAAIVAYLQRTEAPATPGPPHRGHEKPQ